MPARRHGVSRTPAGRLSRAFVRVLPTADLGSLELRAHEGAQAELAGIVLDRARLCSAASIAAEANEQLKPLREERDRLAVVLWAFHRARGSNLLEATGIKNTLLNRVKMKQMGVKAIPKVPGTEGVDFDACRSLLAARGLAYLDTDDAPKRLAGVVAQIAHLHGRGDAARQIRDDLMVLLFRCGALTQAAIVEVTNLSLPAVSKIIREAPEQPQAIDVANAGTNLMMRKRKPTYAELINDLEGRDVAPLRIPVKRKEYNRSYKVRRAVLVRSGGRCESRRCTGMPPEVNRRGEPILDVDHIQDLGIKGKDDPQNMVALCPNCHACKTRGNTEGWRKELSEVARAAHEKGLNARP